MQLSEMLDLVRRVRRWRRILGLAVVVGLLIGLLSSIAVMGNSPARYRSNQEPSTS
jgi:hypothetical protein